MANHDSAEEICRRMAELRRELTGDVREVSRNARVMTDWTFYVRRFPWATAALAVAAGYILVPRKAEVIKPDPEMLAELAKKRQLWVETAANNKQTQGVLKSLLALGVTWAARTGADYMSQRLRSNYERGDRRSPPPVPSPAP